MKKLTPLFLIILVGAMWQFPSIAPVLSMIFVSIGLTIAIVSIFRKHIMTENSASKVIRDIIILVINLLLIIFLGGLAGLIANFYTRQYFGAIAGFISAIAASFAMGYLVNKGVRKLIRRT